MKANPVFFITVRLVPVVGAKLRDRLTSLPVAVKLAAVIGIVVAEVNSAVTVAAREAPASPSQARITKILDITLWKMVKNFEFYGRI